MNAKAKPFIKWVGGKGQLIGQHTPMVAAVKDGGTVPALLNSQ